MRISIPIRSLAAAALLLPTLAAPASALSCTMTVRDGFVCVVDDETGRPVYASGTPAAMLSERDRLLLESGLPLRSRAEFTSAVEDFCS